MLSVVTTSRMDLKAAKRTKTIDMSEKDMTLGRTLAKIGSIKANPNNPRVIKDERFRKLCESIRNFPKMMELRPIVVNADMVVLGGNMRLKACKELGLKEVPIIMADDLTEDQQREFIIKDNVGFGEWDWELVGKDWDALELGEWGLDAPKWADGHDVNSMNEDELNLNEEFDPMGMASNLHKIVFIFDTPELGAEFLNERLPDIKYKKTNGGAGSVWQVNLSETYGN